MNIVTKQEKETRVKIIKRYFADDGTEFKSEEELQNTKRILNNKNSNS